MYGSIDVVCTYEDYAAGKILRGMEGKPSDTTVMKVLRRNRSKRVDKLLDWLVSGYVCYMSYLLFITKPLQEKGAFIALKARNLRSLRVYVHADGRHRENVIETYTFNIKYSANGEPVGVEIDGPRGQGASTDATNASVNYVFRQILQLCAKLPNLPGTPFQLWVTAIQPLLILIEQRRDSSRWLWST